MKYLIAVTLLLMQQGCHCQDESDSDCLEEYRLVKNSTVIPYKSGEEYVYGFQGTLEICYNGTFRRVCTGGSYDQLLIASHICSALGYDESE